MEGGFPGYFAFDWLVWWGTGCGEVVRFRGRKNVVHTKVERGFDRGVWVVDVG